MELSRRFRALKLWMSLQYHGRRAFREAIARDLRSCPDAGGGHRGAAGAGTAGARHAERGLLPPPHEGQRGDLAARDCPRPGVSVECDAQAANSRCGRVSSITGRQRTTYARSCLKSSPPPLSSIDDPLAVDDGSIMTATLLHIRPGSVGCEVQLQGPLGVLVV